MATVSVKYKSPVDPPIESVTLTLSYEEARYIATLVARNSSSGFDNPNHRVFDALYDAGIKRSDSLEDQFKTQHKGLSVPPDVLDLIRKDS